MNVKMKTRLCVTKSIMSNLSKLISKQVNNIFIFRLKSTNKYNSITVKKPITNTLPKIKLMVLRQKLGDLIKIFASMRNWGR